MKEHMADEAEKLIREKQRAIAQKWAGETPSMALPPVGKTVTITAPIKNGQIYIDVEHSPDWDGRKLSIDAYEQNREYIGGVVFECGGDGTIQATSLFVNQEWRRRGVATALYDTAEYMGLRPKPATGGRLKPDGSKFWEARNERARLQRKAAAPSVKPSSSLPPRLRTAQRIGN